MKATACPRIAHRLIDFTLARFDSNRPTQPSYAEQEPPKQPSGRGRGKRKRDKEKQEPLAAEEGAKSPGRKAAASKAKVGERKPMPPVVAAVPVSCTGVALAAAEDDGTRTGKSAKLRVKETMRAFNSHYLHFVQVSLCV
jgi:euchromatic histone-lysine N-methyltransferase